LKKLIKESTVSYTILNEETGEISVKNFKESKYSTRTIKGGFRVEYNEYDLAFLNFVKIDKVRIFIHNKADGVELQKEWLNFVNKETLS